MGFRLAGLQEISGRVRLRASASRTRHVRRCAVEDLSGSSGSAPPPP